MEVPCFQSLNVLSWRVEDWLEAQQNSELCYYFLLACNVGQLLNSTEKWKNIKYSEKGKKMEIYRILHRKTIYLTMFRWLKWNLRRCMSAFYKQLEILPKIKRITSPTLHKVPIHTQKGIKRRKYQTWESTLRKSQTSIDPEIVGSCKSFWRTETHENVIWRLGA